LEHATAPQDLRRTGGVVFASGWHCDWSFLDSPPTLSMLWCDTAPEVGGDTLFCDTAAGLRDRSAPFAAFLRGLTAEHSSDASFAADGVYDRRPVVGAAPRSRAASLSARHSAVLTSPLSGTECLFLNPAYTTRLVELTDDESTAVLGAVFSTLFREEHVIRVRWHPGTLAVWDNHRMAHRALNQGVSGPRRLLRANVRHAG
jgi:taurine dioxygenase